MSQDDTSPSDPVHDAPPAYSIMPTARNVDGGRPQIPRQVPRAEPPTDISESETLTAPQPNPSAARRLHPNTEHETTIQPTLPIGGPPSVSVYKNTPSISTHADNMGGAAPLTRSPPTEKRRFQSTILDATPSQTQSTPYIPNIQQESKYVTAVLDTEMAERPASPLGGTGDDDIEIPMDGSGSGFGNEGPDAVIAGIADPSLTEPLVLLESRRPDSEAESHLRTGYDQLDILPRIKGMFRLLDLYSESGSGGLVDKIIIDQGCMRSLINDISPKAYHSLTRIDFASLDLKSLRMIGLYGSRSELVRFLRSVGVIDNRDATFLLLPLQQQSNSSHPSLRSGLYFLFGPNLSSPPPAPRNAYVIYWPEDTTWDDKAIGAVRKNRVTFTRYLTRLCNQVFALISPEHGAKLVWKNSDDDEVQDFADFGLEDDDHAAGNSDRFFEFEVVVKKEQDEGVSVAPGFTVTDSRIAQVYTPSDPGPSLTLAPRLVTSECRQAFLTGKVSLARAYIETVKQTFSPVRLRTELAKHPTIYIHDRVSLEGWKLLIDDGDLRCRAKGLCNAWLSDMAKIKRIREEEYRNTLSKIKHDVRWSLNSLEYAIRVAFCNEMASNYAQLDPSQLYREPHGYQLDFAQASKRLDEVLVLYPFLHSALENRLKDAELRTIISNDYKQLKKRFLIARQIITTTSPTPEKRQEVIKGIIQKDDRALYGNRWGSARAYAAGLVASAFEGVLGISSSPDSSFIADNADQPDPEFLNGLAGIVEEEPMFEEAVRQLEDFALSWARKKVANIASEVTIKMKLKIQSTCEEQAKRDCTFKVRSETEASFHRFRDEFRKVLKGDNTSAGFWITHTGTGDYLGTVYGRGIELHAQYQVRLEATIEYGLHFLELTQEDRNNVREDPRFVPKPKIHASTSFSLPANHEIKHVQLLGANRCLLITDSPSGISFYLSDPHALAKGHPIKRLPNTIKGDSLFAVDETKRLLAMVLIDAGTLVLQLFAFDETFSTIHSRGSPLQATQWYQDGPPQIRAACFISGTEDLCLLEQSGRIRSFSFISQTFRPAVIQLSTLPINVFCAPDGSALIVVEPSGADGFGIRAFHTATLGSTNVGIVPEEGPSLKSADLFGMSSLENRSNVHLISMSFLQNSVTSASMQISKKTTDFQYQSKDRQRSTDEQKDTDHNSLIDCLADVWTRYPVVPAIKRDPISLSPRLAHSMTYVVQSNHERFRPYFKQMIRDFEASTHKPTERRLDSIVVQSVDFGTFLETIMSGSIAANSFKAGEWLVELLCLIPIHIAIARENRFVPLNNGVIDPALEQRLLGAEVSQIMDALTLGWYESIFNSYLATKPVKVISSMGEQSVGKSYALNHIVDSSFAGSAVRTTEGVWLSVCPSRDLLVVALDFEGVHSIERTPQEDMLLVLFNTALSNMVLFRNNFALSRDVANMFTSFQSSTSVLDPASNPQLFKGLLVVIIKDVVDADKNEIVKEFRSKFTQIVSEEQSTNFITLLHAGQNLVVPWPVIQSRDFYTLFAGLRVKLLQQVTTHRTAGEFLLTLKTLMAKLKAQDWGALDQNLTKHRVGTILSLLPTAMVSGYAELDPEPEPLKNIENQLPTPSHGDTPARFCISKSSTERQAALSTLISQWSHEAARQDVAELDTHLQSLVKARILHVQEWLVTNLARFSPENADVRGLKRQFEDACDKLQSSVQLCRAECAMCRLPCLLNKLHERSGHDCGTSHQCLDGCDFIDVDEHEHDGVHCGLPAGHSGHHMCDTASHCCGLPCDFNRRKGCQGSCMKTVDHSDNGHLCSARIHQCGEPCDLKNVKSPSAPGYSCPNHCTVPHDEQHTAHSCGDSAACPIQCELCPRLCATRDHFHGLNKSAIHLCGQEHPCKRDCAAPGICEINTAPRSVETTFVGAYETFQYTKYTQVARRLPCAIPIRPGERGHAGGHVHSTAPDLFHFCEAGCPSCGYICTLPRGHTQADHETAHGSMDNTSWAIEGAADAAVELQGRKYAPQDVGAPHMCNLVCSHQGRHAHIDYCRAQDPDNCQEEESLHIAIDMLPNPKRPKDWLSHARFWKRAGFRDPYSKDEQTEFACCDVQCAGPEHEATGTQPARPSYCTLPIFHPPQPLNWNNPSSQGYVSADGHLFSCVNPNNLRQAFHVMFVLDKSGSMCLDDRRPLNNTPSTALITRNNNNRFGAVLSALEAFWSSRNAGVTVASPRRDAYSVVLFDHNVEVTLQSDFLSTPQQLLNRLLNVMTPDGGTNFNAALIQTRQVMESHWSTDLSPVVIFLSDGEARFEDTNIYDLCNRAVVLGKALSFHAVSFGDTGMSASLRRMVQVGNEVSQNAPRDPLAPLVPCSFTDAIDTIRLAETFMTIAESLKKPRASLLRA